MAVFTDASDTAWSVIVTDVEKWQSDKPVADQSHRLLHCLSGTFAGSQKNWSVIEKEAFAIVVLVISCHTSFSGRQVSDYSATIATSSMFCPRHYCEETHKGEAVAMGDETR
ncbi:hypothetical protein PHMEG_0006115 [Phytophthora megakarya]|uniref:Reverse transcriptase RNase H-like domain-containing protein n=1 Tax=Phytophthora megakarya TaxID=4795 RepID=A0A225WRN8_9STRA|nr:hypothetical protein PHMEG_0006115 [Phytophthora megakarya]